MSELLFILYIILYVCTIIPLLLDNKDPGETFAWIFVITLFPFIGFTLYMVTGRNWRRNYDRTRKLPQGIAKNLTAIFKPFSDRQEELIKQLKSTKTVYQDDMMTLLLRNSHALLTVNNKTVVFHDGQSKFDSLKNDIKNAKKFIHLQYFIWQSDVLGLEIKRLLIEKARQGVEVRILYDYSGCFLRFKKRDINEMRKEKIEIYPFFNYLANFKLHTLNYRNHRKIAVIDGHIGYTGGMNVGQEYIDGGKKYESWRDTHMRIEGEAVSILQAIFAIDWYNTVPKEDIFEERYYTEISDKPSVKGDLPMQIVTSGYDSPWHSILQLYFTFITAAQKNIYIVSPYFIPDESLMMALKTAAMKGVKVVVLMTGVPDNPIPYWAAYSYFNDLLRAGVRIFQYQAGFLHAKMVSIDGKVSSIGSANFDIRSLKLNYEINAVCYQQELTKDIDLQIEKDLARSKEVTLADVTQGSVIVRLRNSILRLMSGVL